METAKATAVTERRVCRLCVTTCLMAMKSSKLEAGGSKADCSLSVEA
jgi:hypothetical protein